MEIRGEHEFNGFGSDHHFVVYRVEQVLPGGLNIPEGTGGSGRDEHGKPAGKHHQIRFSVPSFFPHNPSFVSPFSGCFMTGFQENRCRIRLMACHLPGRPGQVRTSAAADINNKPGRFVNGWFHVRKPYCPAFGRFSGR
jgi:hypothetical protein